MSQPSPDFRESKQRTAKKVSLSTFILTLLIILVVGFVLGTRSREIMAVIGPVIGIRVDASQLDLSTTDEVYHLLKENYDGSVKNDALADGATKGMTAALGDPFTIFMTKSEASDFSDSLNGRVSGIGAEIGLRNDQPTILRLIDNSPAKSSGLEAGDQITAVNDKATIGLSADKTASLVRGDIGTTVKITIKRGDGDHTYTITRASVTDASVDARMQGSVGILTIRRFDSDTGDLAQRMGAKLKSQGATSIILDLRNDGGGELNQTGGVAGLWLDNGKTVVTVRKNNVVQQTVTATGAPSLKGLPTVILTNGDTASASEIVTGALLDTGSAKTLGEKTYGKGSVQQVFPLSNGQELKVTIARWYTPKGKNINGTGFKPDTAVAMSADDMNAGRDPQLDAALKQLGQ